MAIWKASLVLVVLIVSDVSALARGKRNAPNTRGNFGRPHHNQGHHNQGHSGFGQGQGGFGQGQGGFGQGQGGFGQGQAGFGQGQGVFGQGQGGFGQGQAGFGHGGLGGQVGFVQPGVNPGSFVGGAGSQSSGSATCRYWCPTPEGKSYCCENANQAPKNPVAAVVDKPGLCPPVRAGCPLRSNFNAPNPCSKHGDCFNADRCCFDRCLKEHVCKAPLYG